MKILHPTQIRRVVIWLAVLNTIVIAFAIYSAVVKSKMAISSNAVMSSTKKSFLLQPVARYSSYFCRNVRMGPASASSYHTSCIFSNVQFLDGKLIYFKDPKEGECQNAFHNCPFRQNQIGLRTGNEFGEGEFLTIDTVQGPIAENTSFVRENLSYLQSSLEAENFGHWLVDDLFASYSNIRDFGLDFNSMQLYLKNGCDKNDIYSKRNENGQGPYYKNCKRFWIDFSDVVLQKHVLFLNENPHDSEERKIVNEALRQQYQSNGLYFQNVVVGKTHYDRKYGATRRTKQWNEFRTIFYRKSNVTYIPFVKEKAPVLGILIKGSKRTIVNYSELIHTLEKHYKVVTLDPENHSLNEIIKFISSSDIVISPPGAISMNLFFMQPERVGIVVDYWDTLRNTSAPLEGYWWNSLGDSRLLSYKLQPNEVIFPEAYYNVSKLTDEMRRTTGFFADSGHLDEEQQMKLVRSFADTQVNLDRILRVVREAERLLKLK